MDLKRIKNEIAKRGFTKAKLAREIEVDPSTLYRFLSGQTVLNGEALVALFRILEIDPNGHKTKAS